jgi:hypothetical protein
MTRNRTAIDVLSTLSNQLLVVLLLVLAASLAISRHFSAARDRLRRVEVRVRKRAARRIAL